MHLICVFNIVVRLLRHSTDDLPLKLNLDCLNIMLIVATLSSELVSSISVMKISFLCALLTSGMIVAT